MRGDMAGGQMAHLVFTGASFKPRTARFLFNLTSLRSLSHWRSSAFAGRRKYCSMTIAATSTESRGDHYEQETMDVSHECSNNYQLGWRKLQRASVKSLLSQVHDDTRDQINLDRSTRLHTAADNTSFVLPVTIHNNLSSDGDGGKLFQLCCKGAAVVGSFLLVALLLRKVGYMRPQPWGIDSTALLDAIKVSPSLVGQALSHTFDGAGDTLLVRPQQMRLKVTPPSFSIMNWNLTRLSYMLDVLLERHPITYVLLLIMACLTLIIIGGVLFQKYRGKQSLGDALWDAWACLCSSGTHLREKTQEGRTIGIFLAFGGLLFYSLLTSTLTAQIKLRMEYLREGAHSQVMESGHIIICGANNHITTVLKQLNRAHEFAIRDGTAASRKQTVLLLSERARRETERLVSPVTKECTQINILTRCGSLSSTRSFSKVAADKARSIVLLANKDDPYEADADNVLAVLALQSLLDERAPGNVIVEVSRKSTAGLLKTLSGLKVSPVQNLASKLFVQCTRQCGLVDVYQQLLDHGKTVINLRGYPSLAGMSYGDVRRGFPEAVVCGLIPNGGGPDFHPNDTRLLESTDKLLVIAPKHTQRLAPPALLAKAEERLRITSSSEASTSDPIPVSTDSVESNSLAKFLNRKKKPVSKTADWSATRKERIIILGWRPGVSEMVWEYDDYVGPGSELIILAEAPVEERKACLARRNERLLRNIHVVHKIGNPMSRTDLQDAILDSNPLNLHKEVKSAAEESEKIPFSIIVVGDRGWHAGDSSRPDKQCVFALLLAESICKEFKVKVTSLVAEFVDTKLGKQVVKSHPSLTYIGTSDLTGLVTSQVVEHRELNAVWTELLNSWGNEIYMKGIQLYIKEGESPSFSELQERAASRSEVAIGYRHNNKVFAWQLTPTA
uniref:RCK N-terminal domain-containing protein n=1 Tax=Physcomitrium patens TaxID=3218 RepID=A0A7I4B992_PHYPA